MSRISIMIQELYAKQAYHKDEASRIQIAIDKIQTVCSHDWLNERCRFCHKKRETYD